MEQTFNATDSTSIDDGNTIKHETERALLYLQTFCPEAGDNLYDHLSEVLSKILMERPENTFASFDEYSRKLRSDKFPAISNNVCNVYVPPSPFKHAKKLIKLFQIKEPEPVDEEMESMDKGESEESVKEAPIKMLNMFDLLHFIEPADIGLPRAEMIYLNLSIRKLMETTKVENLRFWGKILGKPKNYYILEANLPEYELERRLQELKGKQRSLESTNESSDVKGIEEENAEINALKSAMDSKSDEDGERDDESETESFAFIIPPLPVNTWEPVPQVTEEILGTGVNEKIFYVCNTPGLDNWIELPTVTPQQIVVARQIVHAFTGNLESSIHTFPPFPGNEKNYLRAQIARIGADTHVSPIGYFKFGVNNDRDDGEEEEEEDDDDDDDDEEEEEQEKDKTKIVKNENYEPLPLADLVDPTMSNWCHHCPYILKQGRVVWQDPTKRDLESEDEESDKEEEESEEEEDGEEEEESHKDNGFVKEIGRPLLTPLSEDPSTEFTAPWTARQSSKIQPDTAVALIRSHIWPGAFAVASKKKFANLYVGWGHKYNAYNYNPPPMPDVEDQYPPCDMDLEEMDDPSFEEEEAYRIAHLPPVPDGEEGEEEEGDPVEVDSIDNDEEE